MKRRERDLLVLLLISASAGLLPSCSKKRGQARTAIIAIDGSSTVYPITEAMAEAFQKVNPARVTIGVSGTGGGFKKFCAGEIAISDASRPIKPPEVKLCAKNKIGYIELPVAYDGISVVVHPKNSWVDRLTVAELKEMWRPEAQGTIKTWSQIRTGWPDKPLRLFGPGVDSGTYDYFTKSIVGKEHASRGDYTSAVDPNVMVQGVATDESALAFFGFAYYLENKKRLKLVPIDDGKADNGAGAIAPSRKTVADGTYQPLSRPIFIYVSKAAAGRKAVQAFVDFYTKNAPKLVAEVGYIPLSTKAYALLARRFAAKTTGSLFSGAGSTIGATVEKLLAK